MINYADMLEHKVLTCDCGSPSHAFYLTFEPGVDESDPPQFYLHAQLTQWQGFWKRLITAVRYLFNREKPNSYHWDTTCLTVNKAKELAAWMKNKIYEDISNQNNEV